MNEVRFAEPRRAEDEHQARAPGVLIEQREAARARELIAGGMDVAVEREPAVEGADDPPRGDGGSARADDQARVLRLQANHRLHELDITQRRDTRLQRPEDDERIPLLEIRT